MKDSEMRGLLLQAFYDHREHPHPWQPQPADFGDQLTQQQIFRIGQQLEQQGLISGTLSPLFSGDGGGFVFARITAIGAEVIEGDRPVPTGIQIVNNSINISHSANVSGIVAGNNNQQTLMHCVSELIKVIESADASAEKKAEAKGLLRAFLEHPLVIAVAGSAAAALLGGG